MLAMMWRRGLIPSAKAAAEQDLRSPAALCSPVLPQLQLSTVLAGLSGVATAAAGLLIHPLKSHERNLLLCSAEKRENRSVKLQEVHHVPLPRALQIMAPDPLKTTQQSCTFQSWTSRVLAVRCLIAELVSTIIRSTWHVNKTSYRLRTKENSVTIM